LIIKNIEFGDVENKVKTQILSITRYVIAESNILTLVQLAERNKHKLLYADLSEDDLGGADLRRADLTGANLSGANLRAYLYGANLTEANLTEAKLTNTIGLTKSMNVKPGGIYWKQFDNGLINEGYQFKVGLNELRPGEVFASDERLMCSFPGFYFASME
jgi:hypothetical protein